MCAGRASSYDGVRKTFEVMISTLPLESLVQQLSCQQHVLYIHVYEILIETIVPAEKYIYYFGADLIYLFEFLVDGDRRNRDRMVVGFITVYVISASKPVHTEMYSK